MNGDNVVELRPGADEKKRQEAEDLLREMENKAARTLTIEQTDRMIELCHRLAALAQGINAIGRLDADEHVIVPINPEAVAKDDALEELTVMMAEMVDEIHQMVR